MIVTLVAILVSIGAIVINPSPQNPSEQAEAEAEEYNKTGYTYSDLGNQEEAIKYYEKAIELKPYYAVAYYSMGLTYQKLGKKSQSTILF